MPMRTLIMTLAALSLAACREAPGPVAVGGDPSDPGANGRPSGYRSVTSDMRDYQVVTPKPWGQSNQRVTPRSN